MVAFCGALAVVKRLTLGFRVARKEINHSPFTIHQFVFDNSHTSQYRKTTENLYQIKKESHIKEAVKCRTFGGM